VQEPLDFDKIKVTFFNAQPKVDLYNYSKPVKYVYDMASTRTFEGSKLRTTSTTRFLDINELHQVTDQHMLLDKTVEKGAFEYYLMVKSESARTIPLDQPKFMKCLEETNWTDYNAASFNAQQCIKRNADFCDTQLNATKKCSSLVTFIVSIDFLVTPQKTVIVRTYARLASILGEIGGLLSLLFNFCRFANAVLTQYLLQGRILSIFFPIFGSKKITQHSKLKSIKKSATEMITSGLDLFQLLNDIACLHILMDIVFDSSMRDLAMLSNLRRFMGRSSKQPPKEEPGQLENKQQQSTQLSKRQTSKERKSERIDEQFQAFANLNSRQDEDCTKGAGCSDPAARISALAASRIRSDFEHLVMHELLQSLVDNILQVDKLDFAGISSKTEAQDRGSHAVPVKSLPDEEARASRREGLTRAKIYDMKLQAASSQKYSLSIPDEPQTDQLVLKSELPPLQF